MKSFKERQLAAGWLTRAQMEAQLGVKRFTIGQWRRQGRIRGRINDLGEWIYWPPDGPPPADAASLPGTVNRPH
jgi:hypothetical protein